MWLIKDEITGQLNHANAEIDGDESKRFRDWCDAEGFCVPTLNGFPYGRFHGEGVKEKVYLPDWRDPERLRYTNLLADLLAEKSEALGRTETIDTGKMLKETRWQAQYIAEFFHFYAGCADKISGDTLPIDKPELFVFTQREPLPIARVEIIEEVGISSSAGLLLKRMD